MPDAFVIHLHTGHGPDHFDLMLQRGPALATWRVEADPAALAPGAEAPAVRLPDHRTAYLTYEGPVRRGRGRVRRVDAGTYERIGADDDVWEIVLSGHGCRGRYALRREAGGADRWVLRRHADAPG